MKKKTTKGEYTASAKVLGKVYTSKGSSVSECLSKLSAGNVKGMAVLTISNGSTSKERILQPAQTNRLFNTLGLTREVAIKNTSLLFEGI